MKITAETELMTNQKHADVMAPDGLFDVLQDTEGDALFFSIGTDHVFYVTREARKSQTGWTRIDLSTQLSAPNGGATVKAKAFDVAQNPRTMEVDIALIVTIAGSDILYLSRGNSTKAENWEKGNIWTQAPFDAAGITPPSPLTIADVYLMDLPSDDPKEPPVENIFVDIIAKAGDPMKLLDRYFINPDGPTRWSRHHLPSDLKAGTISSCLGRRTDDQIPGIYTYGLIEDTRQLIFRPQYNFFRPGVAPNSARLNLPPGATAIASAANAEGCTNLFVAASEGLFLFTPDNQYDKASAQLVVPTAAVGRTRLFDGVYAMSALTVADRTVVWALNANGTLFYTACPSGSEADKSAWNHPLPFYSGVEAFAFYLNKSQAAGTVLFAHLNGNLMMQFTQDAVTSEWSNKRILLPSTDLDKYFEFDSFTSRVTVTDDSGLPVVDAELALTSAAPVPVYVNEIYHVLTPDVPIYAKVDNQGALTIIQETQSLYGVAVKVAADDGTTAEVNPMTNAMNKLSSVKSGDDLSRVTIKRPDGSQAPLISGDVPKDALDNVAKGIGQLMELKDTVPHTPPASNGDGRTKLRAISAATKKGLTAAPAHFVSAGKTSILDAILVAPGDLFAAVKQAWDDFTDWVVDKAEGVWRFVVKIGESIYTAILDCVSAVVDALEMVFNKIKVFFEELKQWLGFLFEWDDIKRTQRVIKFTIKQTVQDAVDSLSTAKGFVQDTVAQLEASIDALAGIEDPGTSIGGHAAEAKKVGNGGDTPQSNWAVQHLRNGASSSESHAQPQSLGEAGQNIVSKILNELGNLVTEEFENVEKMITQIKEQVVDQYKSLSGVQVMKRLLGIMATLVVRVAGTFVESLIELLKIVAQGAIDLLDAPIRIPVLSAFYKTITGNELSALDLACWLGAIPATIIYKMTAGEAPYPTDTDVQKITGVRANSNMAMAMLSADAAAAPRVYKNTRQLNKLLEATSAETQFKALSAEEEEEEPKWGPHNTTQVVLNIAAFIGAIAVDILGLAKEVASDLESSGLDMPELKAIRAGYLAAFIVYIAPNADAWSQVGHGVTWFNRGITLLAITKEAADIFPPVGGNKLWQDFGNPMADTLINAIWLLPTGEGLAYSDKKPSEWLLFTGGVLSCLGGIIAFGATDKFGPEVKAGTIITQNVLNLLYGSLVMGSGIRMLVEKKNAEEDARRG